MRPTVLLLSAAILQIAVAGSFVLQAQSSNAVTSPAASIDFEKDVVPILATHCAGCHGSTRPRGGVSLVFKDEADARARLKEDDAFWDRVETEISTKQMPPAGRKAPTDAQRELLVEWIQKAVMTTDGKPDPGPFTVRRLNN